MSGATGDSASNPPELSVNVRLLTLSDLKTSKKWANVKLPVDFLVLTVKDWELLAFLSQLNDDFYRSSHEALGPVYFGNIRGDEKKQKVAVMRCGVGINFASPGIFVHSAVEKLRPKAVFNVGTCACLKKVNRGDVVLSAKVRTYAYTIGTEDGLQERFAFCPFKRRFERVVPNAVKGWVKPLKDPKELDVKFHSNGVVLSGPWVSNSREEKNKLMKRFRDAISLDTEAEDKGFTIDYSAGQN